MKRLIPSVVFGLSLLLLPGLVVAQQGTVQGTVVDAQSGQPVPGVNVVISETQQGAATDADGIFRISGVTPGEYTLLASFVGYQQLERDVQVKAGSTTQVRLQLQPTAVQMEEVAVTALGLEEDRDQLGASQSQIDGAAIADAAEASVTKSLSAKAAGLQVSSFGGDPGAGARITIRGNTSIQGDNQPLIVVDGQPISNQTFEQGVAGVQQQSRLNDLNPQDIASVEVLKGPSAAALWGSKAADGVIVIETEKGSYAGKTDVSFKTSLRIDEQNQSQNLQEAYGQGFGGRYKFGTGGFLTALSWGDRIDLRDGGPDDVLDGPNDPVAVGQQTGTEYRIIPSGAPGDPHGGKNSKETYDQSTRLFETGTLLENSLSVSGGGEQGRFYLSIGNTRQQGIIPVNSNYYRTSIRLNVEREVTERLTVKGNANYVNTNSDRIQQGSNLDGILLGSYRTPAGFNNADYTVDFYPNGLDGPKIGGLHRAFRSPLGAGANVGSSAPPSPTGPGYANPLFTINRTTNHSTVNRIFGKVEASYDAFDWLNLTSRVGVDTYRDRRNAFFPVRSSGNPSGYQEEQQLNEFQVDATFLARANGSLTDQISSNLTLGFQLTHEKYDELDSDLNNFSNPVRVRNLGNAAASDVSSFLDLSTERTGSVFAEWNVDLFNQVFVTATGRIDQSSTFGPKADDTFFYPSTSVAWQFHKILPENDILSFGKLRASFGRVGRQPNPYQAFTYFSPGGFFDGYTGTTLQASGYGGGFERNNNLGNAIIQPETTTSYEAGLDLRFFNDRITFNGTYYRSRSENVIFGVDVAPSTGFTSRTDNVAEITNRGIELSLDGTWIAGDNFQWNTDLRWSTNENVVQNLAGVREVGLQGFVSTASSLVEGEEYGVLYGNRWRRAPEGCTESTVEQNCEPLTDGEKSAGFTVGENGRVLGPNGFPQQASTQGVIGNPNPDWTSGITNTFSYKGLSLSALVEYRHGGDVWNGTKGALSFFGRHASQNWWTTISADKATNPDIVNYAGCTVAQLASNNCFGGFLSANARENDDGTYSFRGTLKDFGAGERVISEYYYWAGPGSGFTGPGEQFIEDGGFLRLRRVSLSYTWDSDVVKDIGLSSIDLSATARNVLLITNYSGIDPETNLTGPSNGQGLDYFNNPNTRSYQFTIRVNY
ncbi:MAG: SusC/RagA family TonB-linked outer membrane protein [Salinibacter sp.]|uniref:SusC/RagA family TonB-linked outer membrane protein n=1 Tax=Salinibacter sp. TaxID=2065818 RepID=UPI0035D4D09D